MQLLYLTPKPAFFPEAPKNQPYIGAIFGTNLLCLFSHLYYPRPEAGEATRGYMHGGLMIDFVGQLGPSSKLHLFLLDVLILGLQLVMLAVVVERQKLKDGTTPAARQTSGVQPAEGTQQDHDSEERGVHRDDLSPSATDAEAPRDVAPEDPLLEHEAPSSNGSAAELLDMLVSGQGIVASLYIFDTVRNQYWAYQTSATETSGSGNSSLLNRVAEGRRLSMRLSLRGG